MVGMASNKFSEYIIYVDESGDHSLTSVNEDHPVFALAFCIFKKSEYTSEVLPKINQFKFKFWGHDLVILHNREIRRPEKEFGFLTASKEIREDFFSHLNQLMEELPFWIVTSVIDKRRLKEKYNRPRNPYEIALKFCLESAYLLLQSFGGLHHVTNVIVEQRGVVEDKELEVAFNRIVSHGNWYFTRLPFKIIFANKKVNSCGLQIADLVAHPIGRHIINPEQENRSYKIIEQKIIHKKGRGLKVFPKTQKAQSPG